jgi:hypothetical protein
VSSELPEDDIEDTGLSIDDNTDQIENGEEETISET